ncbi:MAG: arylamine N-acetyltransferase [Clostridiales bacterium]|nr:arylamine N-acetyltransferase [Clostridiales bacterium]
MNVDQYLSRIGIPNRPQPTVDALKALQRSHLMAVPYENLDILAGVPLSLEPGALQNKIVARRRGGYCFELNELFGRLLRGLGYGVTDYFARFLRDSDEIPMCRHHVLGVAVPGQPDRYLVDVGVGNGSPIEPVRLVEGVEQRQGDETYRMARRPFLGWVLEEQKRGAWRAVFSFVEQPQLPVDFAAASFYCERSPDSPFGREPMLAIRTPAGRRTLDGETFKEFDRGEVRVLPPEGAEARARRIRDWFGIETN